MSGWMIGLSLTGAFLGAAKGWVGELTHDWTGGTTKPGGLGRFAKATAVGAAIGLSAGWLMTDSKTTEEKIIEACYKNTPTGQKANITGGPNGVTCSYTPS